MGTTHTQRAGGSTAGGKSLIFDAEAMVKLLANQATATGRGEGMTSSELAEKMGFGQDKVRKLLKMAVASGKCRVTRKTVQTMAGTNTVVPSYVLAEEVM